MCKTFFAPLLFYTKQVMKAKRMNADVRRFRRSRDFGASAVLPGVRGMRIQLLPRRLASAPNLRDAKLRFQDSSSSGRNALKQESTNIGYSIALSRINNQGGGIHGRMFFLLRGE